MIDTYIMVYNLRRVIFYGFLLLFLVIAPCILLYAQGYSLDWQKKSIIKTGALYLKTKPKSALVYINGKLVTKTPCLIKRLVPGDYQINITLPGFYNWQKNLTINSNLVTEAREIVLIPQNPEIKYPTDNRVDLFNFNDNSSKLVFWQITDPQQITYINLNQNTRSNLQFSGPTPIEFSWSSQNDKLLVQQTNNQWFVVDLTKQKTINLASKDKNAKIIKTTWQPNNNGKIIFLQGHNLYSQSIDISVAPQKISDNVADFIINNGSILFLKQPGYILYKSDFSGNNQNQLTLKPLLQSTTQTKIITDGNNIGLLADDNLYLLEPNLRVFQLLGKKIINADFSPDTKKLAIQTSNEIFVVYLEKQTSQPQKTAGQKDLLVRLSQPIKKITWHPYDSSHIIYSTTDTIKVIEIDNRDNINSLDFIKTNSTKWQYLAKNKTFYFLNDNNKLSAIKLN